MILGLANVEVQGTILFAQVEEIGTYRLDVALFRIWNVRNTFRRFSY